MPLIKLSQIKNSRKRSILFVINFFVIVLALGAAIYFFRQYQITQSQIKNPNQAAVEQIKTIKARVNKLTDLPTGEEPTLATVSDKDKLKDQISFAKVENGDKVLIFTQAKIAYIYRPSTNKIVNIFPVNSSTGTNAAAAEQQVAANINTPSTIVLRNGTSVTGLTTKMEPKIKTALPQSQITKKENAANFGYEKTVIVILNDSAKDSGNALAKAFGVTASPLPTDEKKPDNADLLVIIGADQIAETSPAPTVTP